jgi:hypothetical protein
MSKLFKLKEWLTLEAAAKHLSTALDEDVSVADIYRLALDGHLVLSMNFPNKAHGNLGVIVGIENTKRFKPPIELMEFIHRDNPENAPREIVVSDYIGNGQFINWDEKVETIEGVWDLPLLASEGLDLEHEYQLLTGGPEITLTMLAGAFIKQGDVLCRLVESNDENECIPGSLAERREIETFVRENSVPPEKVKEIWEMHEQNRKEFLEKKKSSPYENNFYPAGSLPKDGVYVVRTAEIVDFLNRINETPKQEKPLSTKERNSMLSLIAALLNEAKFDYRQKGIAGALATSTEKTGRPLSDDTIRGIIKQVKDLLQ